MKKVLVISTHFDDAVLSAGQFIAGRGGNVDVATVFSGVPQVSKNYVTIYDDKCGFSTSKDAMVVRRQEDAEALALLNADQTCLNLLDEQYINHTPYKEREEQITSQLKAFPATNYELILAPLGLRHPDHLAVSNAAIGLFGDTDKLYLYEDLPHRVTHPEEAFERISEIEAHYWLVKEFIGDGPIADKVRALWCYKSQMAHGDLNPYNLYVPERFHKVCVN